MAKIRGSGFVIKKKMQRPEQKIQIGIFNQLRPLMASQKIKQFIAFCIPNGGYRTPAEAVIFKQMGQMPGAPDIMLMFPARERFCSLGDGMGVKQMMPPVTVFIELKCGKTAQNENQKVFQEMAEAMGFEYHLIRVAADDLKGALNQIYAILMMNGVTGI